MIDLAKTDPALVTAVLNGNKDQFQQLIQRHERMVYAVAWSHLGNVELAEEATQQTFVKAYCSLTSLKDVSKFRSWLATIARNASVSLGRLRRRELSNSEQWTIEPITKPDHSQERANLSDQLRETVAGLPDNHRQVLTLFYLEDQSVNSVAESLGLTESAVKTRLNRARNALRQDLEKRLGESLSELAPSQSLVVPIMAAVTASSLATPAKVTILGKAAIGFSAIGVQLAAVFVSMIPTWFLSNHIAKQTASEFDEDRDNDFRRKVTLSSGPALAIVIFLVSALTTALVRGVGIHTTFFLIAIFSLWGVWLGVKQLKVNDSSLARASIASGVMWFVVCMAIGIFFLYGSEQFALYIMIPIGLTQIVYVALLYRYRVKQPVRSDYNLFLRAATGGVASSDPSNGARNKDLALNPEQLESYAKFLGKRWLITDYKNLGGSIKLILPGAKSNLMQAFGLAGKRSSITINDQGICDLYLCPVDKEAIGELLVQDSTFATSKPKDFVSELKRAMEQSVFEFSNGDSESAFKTLCAVDDSEIFKAGTKESLAKRQKRLVALAIGCAFFIMLLWPTTELLMNFFGLK